MNSRIKFLGYIEESEKPILYNLAKVFVYPSFYEGFGLPVLEAMNCGCPVITSASSSLPEVTGNSALLVNPYKINELAEALSQVLNDENLIDLLKGRGLVRAKNFSWEKSSRKLLSIFQEIKK